MSEGDVGEVLRETMMVVLKLGGPPLIAALAVGLVMSIVQAVTSINEPTVAFVPKVLTIGAMLALAGPFMLSNLTSFTQSLFDRLIALGGQ
jgi:flagellar biosynthesis protein FliQ